MIKKITVGICMCAALNASAQKIELGIAGGVKAGSGYGGSVAGFLGFWKLQVGAVAEMGVINKLPIGGINPTYRTFAPGANFNVVIPFPRGYAYPGIKYRYITGKEVDGTAPISGHEMGVHGGVVVKIFKSLSANAELGLSRQSLDYQTSKLTFTNVNAVSTGFTGSGYFLAFPVMLGLRWAF